MSTPTKARNFCFTINNWTDDDVEFLKTVDCEYMIYGKEVGDEGTPHLQGYVIFKNQRSVKGIVKILRGHISVAKGNIKQNISYCSKDGDVTEHGTRPLSVEGGKAGKRSDIDLVKEMVKEGKSLSDMADVCTSYQSLKFAEKLISIKERKRDWKPNVYWFYGSTGTGKTRTAVEMFPDAWMSGKNLKWWQGYDGHENVIIDDFRGDFCTFHELLRILDRYQYTVEVKGGSRQLLAKNIVITAPKHPKYIYRGMLENDEAVDQLLRRITEIRDFDIEPEVEVESFSDSE